MPLIDQWQGFTGLPDFSDPPAIPTDLKALFDFLAARAIPRYASEAARDAELTSPTDGQMCWVDATATLYVRRGGAWQTEVWPDDSVVIPGTGGLLSSSITAGRRSGNATLTISVQRGTATSGTVIGTVPPGYRPLERQTVVLATNDYNITQAFALVSETTGEITLYMYAGGGYTSAGTMYLRGSLAWRHDG